MKNLENIRKHRFLAWFFGLCLLATTGPASLPSADAGQFSADLTLAKPDKICFPVKIVNHLRKGEFTELTNINEGSQGKQLFSLPAGYAKMEAQKTTGAEGSQAATAERKSGSKASRRGASTDESTAIMFILDASGSMWGRVQGKTKIEIAKNVMTDLIRNLPDTTTAGLAAYGHRRKGDCQDVEELVSLQPINKKILIDKIKSISPKGKTPIATSLIHVADEFKGSQGRNTIILVTDGIESCGADPCKVAKKLTASGVIAKIHVVGFNLTGEAMDQLKCITEPSGGVLVGANSAEELQSSLNEVVMAALPHNLIIRGLDINNKSLFVSVKVLKDGKQIAAGAGGTLRYSLPAGSYRVEVRYSRLDQTIVLEDVVVEENRLTEKDAVFAPATLKIKSLDGKNKALYSSAVIYKAGTDEQLQKHNGSEHVFTLPSGAYDVRISHGPTKTHQWLRHLALTAGGHLEKEVVFAQSKLKIVTLDGNDKALYSSATVYRAGTSEKIRGKNGSKYMFTLLPGVYDVKVTCTPIKEDKWLRNIVLHAEDQLEHQVRFALGKIKVTAFGADGKKLYLGVSVYTAGTDEEIHRATGGGLTFTLKPGAYDIHIMVGKIKKEKWLRGIAIENGANINQKVQF
ncbi:MAG: VWA domain-containing protein [Thermodesulfobacteriota bacterium]|nr:VWA domain-containing protein [Thermodesulfobacteriota bacterium]